MMQPGPATAPRRIWSIGHGARPVEELIETLGGAGVRGLVDVRTAPGSRRHPQFGQDALAERLARAGIAYAWAKDLGGFRKPRPDSRHVALRSAPFRGYADHMETEAFERALATLAVAADAPTAFLCAE